MKEYVITPDGVQPKIQFDAEGANILLLHKEISDWANSYGVDMSDLTPPKPIEVSMSGMLDKKLQKKLTKRWRKAVDSYEARLNVVCAEVERRIRAKGEEL